MPTALGPLPAPPSRGGASEVPAPRSGGSATQAFPRNAVFDAVERVFDLSRTGRDLFGALHTLNGAELDEFLSLTAHLLSQGIVGIETLDLRGRPYQSFITTRIAAPHLRGLRPYRVDLRA